MRKLNRSSAQTPSCLMRYSHGSQSWDDVSPEHKEEIRALLEVIQGRFCAYCEGSLEVLGQHIEHFRPKGRYPKLTFDWYNLFWSCARHDSCGHYKDHGAGYYNADVLINPCADDPNKFLRFRSDGSISVRPILNETEQYRASETLRVFGLDGEGGRLRHMRMQVLMPYVNITTGCDDLADDDLRELLEYELSESTKYPFATAVRHVLLEPEP